MNGDLDLPDLPFEKPYAIEKLESFSFNQREAMDPVEASDRIHEIADSIAESCKNSEEIDAEGCMSIITSALRELGFALRGKFGEKMVAESESAAFDATKEKYPEES